MYYHSRFALQKTSKVIFKLAYDYIHFVSISLKISSYRMSKNCKSYLIDIHTSQILVLTVSFTLS